MTPEELAKLFHEIYEKLAPDYGYETRAATMMPWEEIPDSSPNKQLMIATCAEMLKIATFKKKEDPCTT